MNSVKGKVTLGKFCKYFKVITDEARVKNKVTRGPG